MSYCSCGCAHREGVRHGLLTATAQRAQGCALWYWGATLLSLEACDGLEIPPWQVRPDTENKGESIRERNYLEESLRTVWVTLPAEILPWTCWEVHPKHHLWGCAGYDTSSMRPRSGSTRKLPANSLFSSFFNSQASWSHLS